MMMMMVVVVVVVVVVVMMMMISVASITWKQVPAQCGVESNVDVVHEHLCMDTML